MALWMETEELTKSEAKGTLSYPKYNEEHHTLASHTEMHKPLTTELYGIYTSPNPTLTI